MTQCSWSHITGANLLQTLWPYTSVQSHNGLDALKHPQQAPAGGQRDLECNSFGGGWHNHWRLDM